MISECPHCAESLRNGSRFCRHCGRPLYELRKKDDLRKAAFGFGLAAALICAAMFVIDLFAAFHEAPYIFETLPNYTISLVVIAPYPVPFLKISGVVLQIYYAALLVSVLVSAAIIFYKAAGPLKELVKNGDTKKMKNTALFEISALFSAVLLIQFVFVMLLSAVGTEPQTPDFGEQWQQVFLLLEASVWEEVVSRMLLIGVPLALVCAAACVKNCTPPLKAWKCLIGGTGIDRTAAVLIVFSAFVFGLAHIPGWELWKFFPTFLAGLAMGYLFVKHGVFASIGIHFLTDYMSSLEWLIDGGDITAVLMLALMLFGVPYVWIYLKRCIRFVIGMMPKNTYREEFR